MKFKLVLQVFFSFIFIINLNLFAKDRTIFEAAHSGERTLVNKVSFTYDAEQIYNKDLLEDLRKNLLECGLSLYGPSVLDGPISHFAFNSLDLYKEDKSFHFFSLIINRPLKKAFALAIEVPKDKKEPFFKSIKIYAAKHSDHVRDVIKRFNNEELPLVGVLGMPENLEAYAKTVISHTKSYKSFIYGAKILLTFPNNRSIIRSAIKDLLSSFNNDETGIYQSSLVNMVNEAFADDNEIKELVFQAGLDYKNQETKQISAIGLARLKISSEKIKNLLLSAFTHARWEMRQDSLIALNCIKDNISDEIAIIKMLADRDSDVRNAAVELVNNFLLDNRHLKTLKEISFNKNWNIRVLAVYFISKITSDEATTALLIKLKDNDSDVRTKAYNALLKRNIEAIHLSTLQEVATNSKYEIRMVAAFFIGCIRTDDAANFLISLLGDRDSDVRGMAKKRLKLFNLSDSNLTAFEKVLKSNSWQIRHLAISFLVFIDTVESRKLLIKHLGDRDSDVRTLVVNILINQQIEDCLLHLLAKYLNHNSWEIRRSAISIINVNKSIYATNIIIKALADRDSDVRSRAFNCLRARTLCDANIDSFAVVLNATRYESRVLAARFLGEIKSQKSLDLLLFRLTEETDSDVKEAIIKAIKKIKS